MFFFFRLIYVSPTILLPHTQVALESGKTPQGFRIEVASCFSFSSLGT